MTDKGTNSIQFHYQFSAFYFPNRKPLKQFLLNLIKKEGKTVDVISVVFCDDAYLLQLNKEFLKHDTFTDIITFQLSTKRESISAELYLSIPRIKENAPSFKTTFIKELHRVIFHGVLHLCGFKDKSPRDIKLMRSKEIFYLNKYFISRETFSRKD